MKQLTQDIRHGKLTIVEVPDPVARPGHVLISNRASVVSAGTESSLLSFGRKSLLRKALDRPDHVRRVLEKAKQEGIGSALSAVSGRLDQAVPMGYASAGVVLECGAGVADLAPGDLVASNGPHAEVVAVPRNLCAKVDGDLSPERAAFGVLGAIALHGVRLSRTDLGETVFVVGLGLVGQLCVAILGARGCQVLATDPDSGRCQIALRMGAVAATPDLDAGAVRGATADLGADAVVVAAATASNDPLTVATAAVRKRGRVVVVGDVGMELDRRELYFTEAEVLVSCSYGPGRYDPQYEEHGHTPSR